MPALDPRLSALLAQCVAVGGSDLHLTGNVPAYARIGSEMQPLGDRSYSVAEVATMADSLLADQQRAAFERDLQLDLAFHDEQDQRFRANIFRQRGTVAMVLRHLRENYTDINQLALPPHICDFAKFNDGLVIVTGPTGSGKSTTLSAILHAINETQAKHIITIEDPIEFVHRNHRSLIHQRELHSDVHSFADAIRAALREDPDVLLVGEMRDLDTIRAAFTAAETGHLVFSTLHTATAAGAVSRMLSVFPPDEQDNARNQLAGVLRAVVSQKLLRRKDKVGRVPAVEIMRVNHAVGNLIRSGDVRQIASIIQSGAEEGMMPLEQSLACLVAHELIDRDDAERMATDIDILNSRIDLVSHGLSV